MVTMLENSTRAKFVLEHQVQSFEAQPQPAEGAEIIEEMRCMIKDYEEIETETLDDCEEEEEYEEE